MDKQSTRPFFQCHRDTSVLTPENKSFEEDVGSTLRSLGSAPGSLQCGNVVVAAQMPQQNPQRYVKNIVTKSHQRRECSLELCSYENRYKMSRRYKEIRF